MFVIIDEVYRLNKMRQDHLLPYVESGLLIIAGCTTANPYHSINPAIRSRCQIIEVKPLTNDEIIEGLQKALTSEKGLNNQFDCEENVLKHIAHLSAGDIRFAYNCLELCSIVCDNHHITLQDAKNAIRQANGQFDKDEDQYYDNTYYSQIAGVTTKELGILEAELLEIIDYNLYVKDEEYKKYFEYLTELTKEKRSV